ncbi:LD-carboxypeptidase [uncultured archaeon]|nr:LD-carboxypeptidase [uncultured archaeon]
MVEKEHDLVEGLIPDKIQQGDKIRVISPARSMSIISDSTRNIANGRFAQMGLSVSFSKHVSEIDEFNSSSISSRVDDIHNAFLDKNVKAIFTTIGGFNSNQLLKFIDFNLIKENPKILCGYSDITALANAIYTKTSLVTYSGPHYSTFGIKHGTEYTIEYFKKCLMSRENFTITPSETWSDDKWFIDQEKREFIKNPGYNVINSGKARGTIIGGNLCTLNLLQGTEFMPSLKNTILFIEDDYMSNPQLFDRDLQSLLHLPDVDKVKAVLVGRFQNESNISDKLLNRILLTKKELKGIPLITNLNFGHTDPIITFPIGGEVAIDTTDKQKPLIEIIKH